MDINKFIRFCHILIPLLLFAAKLQAETLADPDPEPEPEPAYTESLEQRMEKAIDEQQQNVIFKEQGLLFAPTDIMHVTFKLNISQLHAACQNYQIQLDHFQTKLATIFPNYTQDHSITASVNAMRHRIIQICETPRLFYSFESFRRRRRGAGVAAVAVAIAATAGLGIYNSYQISQLTKSVNILAQQNLNLEKQVQTIHDSMFLLSSTNARLSDLSANILETYDNMENLINGLTVDNVNKYTIMMALEEFSRYIMFLEKTIERFEQGFMQLENHKISLDLINPSKLLETWTDITYQADKNAKLLFQNPFDLLHLPATYSLQEDLTLNVFLHVPIAATTYTLTKYVPFPLLPVDEEFPLIIKPKSNKYLLAIDEDKTFHTEINEADLTKDCYNFLNNFICDDLSLFHKHPSSTCLGSLNSGVQKGIEEHCYISNFQGDFAAHTLKRNTFMFYSKHPITYKKHCPQKDLTKGFATKGFFNITLDPACYIDAAGFKIQATAMSQLKKAITFPIWLNFTTIAGGITLKQVRLIKRDLEALHIPPAEKIVDMIHQAERAITAVRHFPHYGTNVALIALAVLITVSLALLCGCSQCLRLEVKRRINVVRRAYQAIQDIQLDEQPQQGGEGNHGGGGEERNDNVQNENVIEHK